MLIIFRKSDGAICSNSGVSSGYPEGPPFEAEVQNAINMFGGQPEDYGEYRINSAENPELARQIAYAGSYELLFDEDNNPVDVIIYPRITLTIGKTQITAGGADIALITANVGDPNNNDEIEFFVDGQSIGAVQAEAGVAELEFTAEDPGIYTIRAENKTPPPCDYFISKHGWQTIRVEAV